MGKQKYATPTEELVAQQAARSRELVGKRKYGETIQEDFSKKLTTQLRKVFRDAIQVEDARSCKTLEDFNNLMGAKPFYYESYKSMTAFPLHRLVQGLEGTAVLTQMEMLTEWYPEDPVCLILKSQKSGLQDTCIIHLPDDEEPTPHMTCIGEKGYLLKIPGIAGTEFKAFWVMPFRTLLQNLV